MEKTTIQECKSCRETVRMSEQELRQVFGDVLHVREVKLTDEETYEARLAACRRCDALLDETTCLHCGCVVAVKAKLRHARCPYPFDPRW